MTTDDRIMAPALRMMLWVLALVMVGGCRSAPANPQASAVDERLSNGYSLLYELVGKQKNVDKLLWLKSPPTELVPLIHEAAKVSADAEKRIARFAQDDARLALDRQNLPPIERGVREAIEASTTRRLLLTSEHFATLLALKQFEATEYGLHLAQVIAEADTNQERQTWLDEFEQAYTDLRDRLTAWLAAR